MNEKELYALRLRLLGKAKKEETFTKEQMLIAVEQFLAYGEESFNPDKVAGKSDGHGGYFSGSGWAARALRGLQRQLDGSPIEL